MGPGSKIKALIDALKKNLIYVQGKKTTLIIDFTDIGFKLLPLEVCRNEEICQLATVLMLRYNKLKNLPENVSNLANLKYVDMRNNPMTYIPFSFFQCYQLEYVSSPPPPFPFFCVCFLLYCIHMHSEMWQTLLLMGLNFM